MQIRALKRKDLRRYAIYDTFVSYLTDHGISEQASRAGTQMSPSIMKHESNEFCSRLAVMMTERGLPKVAAPFLCACPFRAS